MGRQLETTVSVAGVTRRAVSVHLDSQALQISGRPRIAVAFGEISRVEVDGGSLTLATPRGLLVIQAGEQAEAWAAKIRTPPTRAKKLGLRAGARVTISGLEDPALNAELESAGARLVAAQADLDLIFFGVAEPKELTRLPALVQKLAPDGALWIVRSKGRAASVSEQAVRTAARAAGLVDVKVVSFSATRSADKFVIPVAERRRTAAVSGAAQTQGRTPKPPASPRKPAKKRRAKAP